MGQVAVTHRIGRAASPSRKQIRHVGGGGVGVGAREAGGGGCDAAAAAVIGIIMGEGWEIGTTGRKGWMDRVEWAGDQLEAVGAIIVKSRCSTLDCECLSVTLYARTGGWRWGRAGCDDDAAADTCCAGRPRVRRKKKNNNGIWIFAQRTAEKECWPENGQILGGNSGRLTGSDSARERRGKCFGGRVSSSCLQFVSRLAAAITTQSARASTF